MRKLSFILIISLFVFTACTTPAESPTPASAPELPQNFSATLANATLSIDYPADWVVSAEFADLGITIATSSDLANTFDGTVEAGEVYISVLYVPESSLNVDTPSASLQEVVDSIANPEGTVSAIETRTLNGKVAAFVTLDAENSTDGMFLVIDSGDGYSTVVAAFSDGTLADNQATIEAIAGSIEYISTAVEVEVTPEATESSD